MKKITPHSFRTVAVVLACLIGSGGTGFTSDAFPVGWLNLTTKSIVLGTRPRLEWEVVPSSLGGQVDIQESGSFSILRDTLMKVRVLGVSVAPGAQGAGSEARVEVRMQVDGAGYHPIFFDSQQRATPDKVALSRDLSPSSIVDFGARIEAGEGLWSDWYSSTNTDRHVVALRNGDPVPATVAANNPQSYLAPYLDPVGKILIGPNDLLLLIEANADDSNDPGFDGQDVALLVTFSDQFPQ